MLWPRYTGQILELTVPGGWRRPMRDSFESTGVSCHQECHQKGRKAWNFPVKLVSYDPLVSHFQREVQEEPGSNTTMKGEAAPWWLMLKLLWCMLTVSIIACFCAKCCLCTCIQHDLF